MPPLDNTSHFLKDLTLYTRAVCCPSPPAHLQNKNYSSLSLQQDKRQRWSSSPTKTEFICRAALQTVLEHSSVLQDPYIGYAFPSASLCWKWLGIFKISSIKSRNLKRESILYLWETFQHSVEEQWLWTASVTRKKAVLKQLEKLKAKNLYGFKAEISGVSSHRNSLSPCLLINRHRGLQDMAKDAFYRWFYEKTTFIPLSLTLSTGHTKVKQCSAVPEVSQNITQQPHILLLYILEQTLPPLSRVTRA